MRDKYFDPEWEKDHVYLAGLWRKLLPSNTLHAEIGNIRLLLQKDFATTSGLALFWGAPDQILGGFISEGKFVTSYDLSRLFEKAHEEGLDLNIEQDVPLETWVNCS